MKTNSRVKSQKSALVIGQKNNSDAGMAQHAANGKLVLLPNYSSMEREIDKIRDPVSFDEIKDFYNVT